jgi:hypothetical protein
MDMAAQTDIDEPPIHANEREHLDPRMSQIDADSATTTQIEANSPHANEIQGPPSAKHYEE